MWALSLALLVAGAEPVSQIEAALRDFTRVYARVEREAAEPVEPAKAIYGGAIPSMLRLLDPHSVFFDPDQFEQLQKLQESVSRGFGSVVSILPGRVIVLQTQPGSPSARAGLAPGDEILSINGIPLGRLGLDQLSALLEASRQKPVTLDVRRPGATSILQFVLTPQEMQQPSVELAFLLRPGVGYVRVTSFDAPTGADAKKAIEKLGGVHLKALVLDLRKNPGGLLPSALEMAALFLKPGQTILSVGGRSIKTTEEKVPESARPYAFPLAVLVDSRSASAAEIVAGSLQDHDRAVIVGETTYGKGLVESVLPLSDGAGLALTTAFYYTPSGRSIQKPLDGGLLGRATAQAPAGSPRQYHTDSGRVVQGGGGIQPDRMVFSAPLTRLQAFLDVTGAFPTFAAEYLRRNPGVSQDFEATPHVLDEFRGFLAAHDVVPGIQDWSPVRNWIASRLKTEIFNQAFGVDKGDEIEAQRDDFILAALKALGVS